MESAFFAIGPWRFAASAGTADVFYRSNAEPRAVLDLTGTTLEDAAWRYVRWADENYFVADVPGPAPTLMPRHRA